MTSFYIHRVPRVMSVFAAARIASERLRGLGQLTRLDSDQI